MLNRTVIVFILLGNISFLLAQEEQAENRMNLRLNTVNSPLGVSGLQNSVVSPEYPYRMNLISPDKSSMVYSLDMNKGRFTFKPSDKNYFGTLLRNEMPVTRHLMTVPLIFSKQVSKDLTFFITATPYVGSSLSSFGRINHAAYPQFDNPLGVSHFTKGINLSTGVEYKNWLFKVQYDLSGYDDKNKELPDIDKESLLFSVIYFF